MSKHTPGPWELSQSKDWPWAYSIKSVDRQVMSYSLFSYSTADTLEKANARPANGECHANARLIAAAPDLLEALLMVRDADNDAIMDGLACMPRLARAKIEAAIAKATGND